MDLTYKFELPYLSDLNKQDYGYLSSNSHDSILENDFCKLYNYRYANRSLECDLPSVNFVRNDWRLVDDDVHESEDVGAGLEVKEDGRVAVHDAALGQDGDGDRVRR